MVIKPTHRNGRDVWGTRQRNHANLMCSAADTSCPQDAHQLGAELTVDQWQKAVKAAQEWK